MPLRPEPFLRFLFAEADLDRIDPASVAPVDEPYSATPAPGRPYPQALRLSFRVLDPSAGPPRLQPLFPGALRFIADPSAPGSLPSPLETDVDDAAAYATWNTLGTLMVALSDRDVTWALEELASGLGVSPNVAWYAPVRIPREFLATALSKLGSEDGIGASPVVWPDWPDWRSYAASGFLAGTYQPELRLGEDEASDDVAQQPMPVVEMAEDGAVELWVHLARATDPQDAPGAAFDELAAGTEPFDPVHPRNGAVPARHVYRSLRDQLVGAGSAHPVKDKVLADWPQAPGYLPLRFTRSWTPVANCSAYFPAQVVHVEDAAPLGAALLEQRLAAHGVLWLTQPPLVEGWLPEQVRVSLTGGMRWLDGATPESWRVAAAEDPLVLDLLAEPVPHVVLRRRMAEEMLADTDRPAPKGPSCTYMSLRRAVRALVDQRITGGRLVFETLRTSPRQRRTSSALTLALMRDAWGAVPADIGAEPDVLADCKPSVWVTEGDPLDAASLSLERILRAFFPDEVLAELVHNSLTPRTPLDGGQVAYDLWLTVILQFQCDPVQRNFSELHIGRGGAGSMVSRGLADYHVDLAPDTGEGHRAYVRRVATAMLSGLEPGAVLQWWMRSADYDALRTRGVPLEQDPDNPSDDCFDKRPALSSFGHSPVFESYLTATDGTVTGIKVIDQEGTSDYRYETDVKVGPTRVLDLLHSEVFAPEVWSAANWRE